MRTPSIALAAMVLAAAVWPAAGQEEIAPEPSVWDLTLGSHASELPSAQFVDYACGTDGGPPSRPLSGWTEYGLCPAESATGWHEIYFRYDDEREYIALAVHDDVRAAVYAHTTVSGLPVIASVLFDDDGFMRGLRLVSDPRVDLGTRELAYTLGGFLQARYDGDWQCEQLPRLDGETPYQGIYIKKRCILVDAASGISRDIETHLFRRPGQTVLNPNNLPTQGYFESSTRFEEFLTADVVDREQRLAAIAALPPPEENPLVVLARDCAGCDLAGVDLKRADLSGANLAGANLEGANLHAVNLTGANLAGANLRNTNLNRAMLTRADLSGADLSGALLYEARLDGANLAGASMVRILAGHARFIRADLSNANVSDSDLTEAFMTSVVATNATFARTRLWTAQLSRAAFDGAIFIQADLHDAIIAGSTFVDADFRSANLYATDLRDSDFTGVDFSGAVLTDAIFARTIFDGAVFEGATLPGGFTPP